MRQSHQVRATQHHNLRHLGGNMKQNIDIPIGAAGITAPMWLEPLNQWLALVVAVGSIVLIAYRFYVIFRSRK